MPKCPADFDTLKAFVLDRTAMQMSHIYKPVMLQTVLANGGAATRAQIAAAFLARDALQQEHYRRKVVDEMPGKRLVRDGILQPREGETYRLAEAFSGLTQSQRLELVAACERRIEEHIASYGDPYSGRNLDPVPNSIRDVVLTRAGGRCEKCGIGRDIIPLHVDHIVPRSLGGSNDENNLQALCQDCNLAKGTSNSIAYRAVNASYAIRDTDCVFCDPLDRVILENELAVVIEDAFAVTTSHSLVIPRRHVADYFDLYQSERNAIDRLLRERRHELVAKDKTIAGFNVGINTGKAAGQTIGHVHVHLIPRREGDVADPAVGVRGVIPARQRYA